MYWETMPVGDVSGQDAFGPSSVKVKNLAEEVNLKFP